MQHAGSFLLKTMFIYFWLCRVFVAAQALVAAGGSSFLVAVASLIVEHGLSSMQASVVGARGLSSCRAQAQ